jgi:phosphoenolpyruvate carboxylase
MSTIPQGQHRFPVRTDKPWPIDPEKLIGITNTPHGEEIVHLRDGQPCISLVSKATGTGERVVVTRDLRGLNLPAGEAQMIQRLSEGLRAATVALHGMPQRSIYDAMHAHAAGLDHMRDYADALEAAGMASELPPLSETMSLMQAGHAARRQDTTFLLNIHQIRSTLTFVCSGLGADNAAALTNVRELEALVRNWHVEASGSTQDILTTVENHSLTELKDMAHTEWVKFVAYLGAGQANRTRRRSERQEYALGGSMHERSLPAIFNRWRTGYGERSIAESGRDLMIKPRFTAHPNRTNSTAVLEQSSRIAERLLRNKDIETSLRLLCLTDPRPSSEPDVLSEMKDQLTFLPNALKAERAFLRRLMSAHYDEFGAYPKELPRIHWGSWWGGDADGNPFVGPEHILVSHFLSVNVICKDQAEALGTRAPLFTNNVPEALLKKSRLRESIENDASLLGDKEGKARGIDPQAPFLLKAKILAVQARLEATASYALACAEGIDGVIDRPKAAYESPDAYLADLELLFSLVRDSVSERDARRMFGVLIHQTNTHGLHGLELDTRRHRKWSAQLLADVSRIKGSVPDVRAALLNPDKPLRPDQLSSIREGSKALLDSLGYMKKAQASAHGTNPRGQAQEPAADRARNRAEAAAETFIVSHFGEAEEGAGAEAIIRGAVDDMLNALLAAKQAGLVKFDGKDPFARINLVPLIEDEAVAQLAPKIYDRLLNDFVFQNYVALRGGRIEAMFGPSDLNLQSGMIAASETIYRLQRDFTALATRHGVAIDFFIGRGSDEARGGGSLVGFVEANAARKFTVQGASVSRDFADIPMAMGFISDAILQQQEKRLKTQAGGFSEEKITSFEARWHTMAETGKAFYKEHLDLLFKLFQDLAPLKAFSQLNISTRPVGRDGVISKTSLRAIPWVLGWNVLRGKAPSIFQAGTALKKGVDEFGIEALKEMLDWAPFGTLIDRLETALASVEIKVLRFMQQELSPDKDSSRAVDLLEQEYETAKKIVLDLRGYDKLLKNDRLPIDLEFRNVPSHSLVFIYTHLRKQEKEGDSSPELHQAILETVFAMTQAVGDIS